MRGLGFLSARLLAAITALIGACLIGEPARALDPSRAITQFQHTTWSVHDGLPGGVSSTAQTPDGYLWLATSLGLYRFDGVRFEDFSSEPSARNIGTIMATPSGDLWLSAPSSLARYRHGAFTAMPTPGFQTPFLIRFMASSQNGDVWAASDGQVARFDGRAWHVVPGDWGSSEGFSQPGGVWALAVARDGVVWVKNAINLYYLRPGATRFLKADGYGGGVFNFAKAPDGRLWTSDFASMHFYALPDLGPAGPPPPPAQVGAQVPVGMVGWLVFDRDGALWCGNTVTSGLYRARSAFSSAPIEVFTEKDGMTSDIAGEPLEDHEGDIWIGTPAGLERFSPANVVTDNSLRIRDVHPDMAGGPNAIIVADGWPTPRPESTHAKETIYRIANGSTQRLPIEIGQGTLVSSSPTGDMLVGNAHQLFSVTEKGVAPVPLPDAAKQASLSSATQYGEDIWIQLAGAGAFHRHAGVWTPVPGMPRQAGGWIRADNKGSIWVFSDDVVRRLAGDRLETLPAAQQPNVGPITTYLPTAGGFILAGTQGVSWFDGRVFHTLSPQQTPFLSWVTGVVFDDRGGVWFRALSGIYRVSADQFWKAFADPAVRLDYQLFDSRDGLKFPESRDQVGNMAARAADGRIAFLDTEGLEWIDPARLDRNTAPPPVHVQSLTAGGRVFDGGVKQKLAAGTSNIEIAYTALSLQSPERVRFKYRLEGVDPDWIDAGARRQAFYTKLLPGHYVFPVIAANNDGVWNQTGASFAFEIPPTFVQSRWFALLCTLFVGLVLWAAYRLRLRQVTAAIQSRHEERIAERERIARELHDTLLQGFQGLVLHFQAILEGLPPGAPARSQIGKALDRADQVLISGRDRVHQLRAVDSADLADAFIALADTSPTGSDTRLQVLVEGAARTLRPIVTEELDAIGQEAIVNAFRHARAETIKATLAYGRRAFTLLIIDNGVGMPPDVLAQGGRDGHFGLVGMRERAAKIQAKVSISSTPHAGAEIKVVVPARIAYARGEEGLWGRLVAGLAEMVPRLAGRG